MKIEHVAFLVADPVAIARWWQEHLGMALARSSGAPGFGHFLADSAGDVLVELYRNDALPAPDYRSVDPAVLHLAFSTDDVPSTRARLLRAGATPVGEPNTSPNGDQFAVVRDPWGFAIQLVRRQDPML
jgi:catechol 2,3-dioxygenase-like lactoylglutathione lyase family enzyme